MWRRVVLALAAALVFIAPASLFAHDIPSSVRILAFIKPDGDRLRLVMRVPLEAMRDIKWPTREPAYLIPSQATTLLPDAAKTWIADYIRMYENGTELSSPTIVATRISLPSDRSFEQYSSAVANFASPPVPDGVDLTWQAAMLDVQLEYRIQSPTSRFSIEPMLARLGVRTLTVLRFVPVNGSERAFEYLGDPGVVHLDPQWYQAALSFVKLGFLHIMDGIDHLLFVFCLVIPFRKLKPLLTIVTAFTVAHSITLIASAAGFAPTASWFPPLIEVLIALSIVYMALENIVGAKLERRWMVAFGFGLVHGFGFSFALRESLQFAGRHLATSLVAFNVGVELGQILVLVALIPVLEFLFKRVVAERMGTIILSAFVAHTAWHWMLERFDVLRQYPFTMPELNAAFAASVMRGLATVLLLIATGWLVNATARRFSARARAVVE